jgi:hypothetical protein
MMIHNIIISDESLLQKEQAICRDQYQWQYYDYDTFDFEHLLNH